MPPEPTPPPAPGEVAYLRVVGHDPRGLWLDWGHPEPLLLPKSAVVGRPRVGTYCLVWIGVHDEGWPFASMKLDRYVAEEVHGLIPGDRVSLVIADETPLGVKAVVNHRFWGLLYANELFQRVHKGQTVDGYVKAVRPDKRLDVTLSAPGYAAVDLLTDVVLQRLEAAGGFLPLTDKSPPEAIYREFGVSKKQFKQAVGALFKRRRVALEPEGIRLLPGRSGP